MSGIAFNTAVPVITGRNQRPLVSRHRPVADDPIAVVPARKSRQQTAVGFCQQGQRLQGARLVAEDCPPASRQALAAYRSVELFAQREYVQQMHGIDIYI